MAVTKSTISDFQEIVTASIRLGLSSNVLFFPGADGMSAVEYIDLTGGQGLTSKGTIFDVPSPNAVGENQEYQGWQDLTLTSVDVTASKTQVGYIASRESLRDAKSELDLFANLGKNLGQSMANEMNKNVCTLFASATTSVGSTGVDLTLANIRSAINTLQVANARGPISIILHATQWGDLVGEGSSPLGNASYTGTTGIAEQVFNQWFISDALYGARFLITNDVQTTNAGADYAGVAMSPEAIRVVTDTPLEVEVEWNKNKQSYEVLATGYWGQGIQDQNQIVGIVTDA